jgi:hypothetical protein
MRDNVDREIDGPDSLTGSPVLDVPLTAKYEHEILTLKPEPEL